jgi:hypothetical protein
VAALLLLGWAQWHCCCCCGFKADKPVRCQLRCCAGMERHRAGVLVCHKADTNAFVADLMRPGLLQCRQHQHGTPSSVPTKQQLANASCSTHAPASHSSCNPCNNSWLRTLQLLQSACKPPRPKALAQTEGEDDGRTTSSSHLQQPLDAPRSILLSNTGRQSKPERRPPERMRALLLLLCQYC